jgi:hypothetical protein
MTDQGGDPTAADALLPEAAALLGADAPGLGSGR